MSPKLTSTNPYLRDPATRERTVTRSVATSTAVEGVHAPFKRSAVTGKFLDSKPAAIPKKR